LYKVKLSKLAEKSLRDFSDKNKEIEDLLISKLEDLQNIDIQSALKSRKVGIIEGLPQKALKRLKERNFDEHVYEYRDFPKSKPFRMVFIIREDTIVVILIVHNQQMKEKFNNLVSKKLTSYLDLMDENSF
jgi:hypothetical protein